jgi:hypothetical protein
MNPPPSAGVENRAIAEKLWIRLKEGNALRLDFYGSYPKLWTHNLRLWGTALRLDFPRVLPRLRESTCVATPASCATELSSATGL